MKSKSEIRTRFCEGEQVILETESVSGRELTVGDAFFEEIE